MYHQRLTFIRISILIMLLSFILSPAPSYCNSILDALELPESINELPEQFPKEIWLDVPLRVRMAYDYQEQISITALAKVKFEELAPKYVAHLEDLGWTATTLKEVNPVLAEQIEELENRQVATPNIPESEKKRFDEFAHAVAMKQQYYYKKGDQSIELELFPNPGDTPETQIQISYRSAELNEAYNGKFVAFGENDEQAKALLDKIIKRYQTCESYREVCYLERSEPGNPTNDGALLTEQYETRIAYKRDGLFRIEKYIWETDPTSDRRELLFRDAEDTTYHKDDWGYSSRDDDEPPSSEYGLTVHLHDDDALLIDVIISGEEKQDEAYHMSPLLSMERVKMLPDQTIDAETFKGIHGITDDLEEYKIWFHPETYIIRKIEHTIEWIDTPRIHTLTYDAEMDIALEDSELSPEPYWTIPKKIPEPSTSEKVIGWIFDRFFF